MNNTRGPYSHVLLTAPHDSPTLPSLPNTNLASLWTMNTRGTHLPNNLPNNPPNHAPQIGLPPNKHLRRRFHHPTLLPLLQKLPSPPPTNPPPRIHHLQIHKIPPIHHKTTRKPPPQLRPPPPPRPRPRSLLPHLHRLQKKPLHAPPPHLRAPHPGNRPRQRF